MAEPPYPRNTVVARLITDLVTAVHIQDGLAEHWAGEPAAVAIAEDPDGRWSVAVHFAAEPDTCALRTLIASLGGEDIGGSLVFETLPPTDWVRKSLEGLRPVEAGRFVVHGKHDRERVCANRVSVQIEASLAFGTGHHASTRGCLLALDHMIRRCRRKRIANSTARPQYPSRKKAAVLDIGTGSGVLAIAAAKAMRLPVLASDMDGHAAAIAREHARVNGVAAKIEIVQAAGVRAGCFHQRSPFALVFANIVLGPLRQLASPIRALIAPGGVVVLSGLLNAQAGPAVASYTARGFVLVRRFQLEGWTTLILALPPRTTRGDRSRH